jgi:hypothetical protein
MQKVERMSKAEKLPWDDIEPPTKPSMEYTLMEDRVRKAKDLADLKRIWAEIAPALKDIRSNEKKRITEIKDERKTQLQEVESNA